MMGIDEKNTAKARTFSRVLTTMLLGADVAALFGAGSLAIFLTIFLQKNVFFVPVYDQSAAVVDLHQSIYFVLALVFVALFWERDLYTRRVPWWTQVKYVIKAAVYLCFVHGFISFALKLYESRLLIFMTWSCVIVLSLSFRFFVYALAARIGLSKIPTVLIGTSEIVTDVAHAFSTDACAVYGVDQIFLKGSSVQDFDRSDLPVMFQKVPVSDDMTSCEAFIRSHPQYFYIVAMEHIQGDAGDHLIDVLNQAHLPYAVVPAISGVNLYQMKPTFFFGNDVVLLETRQIPRGFNLFSLRRMMKRGMDIVISALALLVLSPLFLVVAVMLKVEGQSGSVFYGGKRIGKGGRLFKCWKFQSMEPKAKHLFEELLARDAGARDQWEKFRKLQNDPRVTTKTAKVIRKTSIDELPQLWNVLMGEMSLVGPRPILDDEVHFFEGNLDDYLSVRPGITGLWQVSGRNDTSFKRRVYWDNWYVRNWSLWGDIVILAKTPIVLLTRKGVN